MGARLADLQQQHDTVRARHTAFRAAKSRVGARLADLQQQHDTARARHTAFRAAKSRVGARLADLQQQHDTARARHAAFRAAKSRVGARLATVEQIRQQQVAELQSRLAMVRQELSGRVSELSAARDAALAQWQALQHQLLGLKPQLRSAQARNEALENRLTEYEQIAARVRQGEVVGGYRSARDTLQTINDQLRQLRNNIDSMQQALQ